MDKYIAKATKTMVNSAYVKGMTDLVTVTGFLGGLGYSLVDLMTDPTMVTSGPMDSPKEYLTGLGIAVGSAGFGWASRKVNDYFTGRAIKKQIREELNTLDTKLEEQIPFEITNPEKVK